MKIPENLNQEQIDALTNLLKSFEEPKEKLMISGWYVNDNSEIIEAEPEYENKTIKNLWATKEQAEACLAMSELSQLMKEANGDWKPDFTDESYKYVIYQNENEIEKDFFIKTNCFLAFETKEIRDEFFKKNKTLILKAKPLL